MSVLAPMGVDTKILWGDPDNPKTGDALAAQKAVSEAGGVLDPEDVARTVLDAVEQEEFLILPHPEVLDMYRMKGADYDRWLTGMRRYQAKLRTIVKDA